MHNVVISGTGLYTPANSISNEELAQSFNTYVQQFNTENAAAIERGDVQALTESSAAFIEKASGIKSRFVMDKDGILDPQRMTPRLPERSNDEWSILCQMAIGAAEQALAACRQDRRGYRRRDRRLLQPATGLPGHCHRSPGSPGHRRALASI